MSDSYTAQWKSGFRGSGILPAETARKELEKIRKKNDGELNPQYVVNAAKSNRHKLHKFFDWDDTSAANEYRLTQARSIIRSIVVVRPELPDKEFREYHVQRSKIEPRKQTYSTTAEIMQDPEARAELLQRALGELLAVRRKFVVLQELTIVFRAIDEVLETVKV